MTFQILGNSLKKEVILKEICKNFSILSAQIILPLLVLKTWDDSSRSNTHYDHVHTVAPLNYSVLLLKLGITKQLP